MSAVFSLYKSLTEIPGTKYGATELSQELISLSGQHICNFKRNAQTTYRIISRAREICKQINTLIERVERENDWNIYDKYSSAVGPLEEYVGLVACIVMELELKGY